MCRQGCHETYMGTYMGTFWNWQGLHVSHHISRLFLGMMMESAHKEASHKQKFYVLFFVESERHWNDCALKRQKIEKIGAASNQGSTVAFKGIESSADKFKAHPYLFDAKTTRQQHCQVIRTLLIHSDNRCMGLSPALVDHRRPPLASTFKSRLTLLEYKATSPTLPCVTNDTRRFARRVPEVHDAYCIDVAMGLGRGRSTATLAPALPAPAGACLSKSSFSPFARHSTTRQDQVRASKGMAGEGGGKGKRKEIRKGKGGWLVSVLHPDKGRGISTKWLLGMRIFLLPPFLPFVVNNWWLCILLSRSVELKCVFLTHTHQ